ncbi:MAG: alpha/beta hydrolase [Nevskia sp.]|nr:alpha/beta hydrolase [Nevskia sp.]
MEEAVTFKVWYERGQRYMHRGHPVFYQTGGSGDGPALLLLHGSPTASWDWHKLWPALCARFGRVVAADMIGFGYSAKPRDYDYTIADQADLQEGLLTSLGIGRCHVIGHGYGDTVAQELLARQEERRGGSTAALALESLCLLNGGLFPEAFHPTLLQKLLLSRAGALVSKLMTEHGFQHSFSRVFGPNTQPSFDELAEFWQLIAYNGGADLAYKQMRYLKEREQQRERWVEVLQRTRVPLRLICGKSDPVCGLHMAERYRQLVPNPDLVLLPGIGHYPQIESPEETLQAYLEFRQGVTARA